MIDTDALTLDELGIAMAPAIAEAAVFDGWSKRAVASAAAALGVDPDVARLAYPGGAMDMIAAWVESVDAAMIAALPADLLDTMSVSGRVRALLTFRLEHLAPGREALRRALAIMALPINAKRTAKLGWRSADRVWRAAGDGSTDFSHYTKRAILASIYAATLAVFVADESEGQADTYSFLQRRLEGVAKFNKAKAQWAGREYFSVPRFLGRLRYPAR